LVILNFLNALQTDNLNGLCGHRPLLIGFKMLCRIAPYYPFANGQVPLRSPVTG